ncbi:hypothetical protein [Piscibacillus salipiscarius]|uniref:Uncharacterized protein n=1 Tax=Piscibacillus salipiscarius TaxID=299480 RepID=A0ABW5Q9G7_9BACI
MNDLLLASNIRGIAKALKDMQDERGKDAMIHCEVVEKHLIQSLKESGYDATYRGKAETRAQYVLKEGELK